MMTFRRLVRLPAVIGVCASLLMATAFPQVSFITRKEFKFPTFHDTISVASADFDGNGTSDVAVLSRVIPPDTRGIVTILLGDGIGNLYLDFSNVYHNQLGGAEIIAADFNGDSFADLAVTNEDSNSVSIFLNNQTGYFTGPANVAVGDKPVGLVAADLDQDGDQDLAVTNTRGNSITLLRNGGAGMFSLLRTVALPQMNGPRGIAAADLGRGLVDLVVANFGAAPGTVLVLLNDGAADPAFTLGSTLTVGNNPRDLIITYIDIADFNVDIVVTNFFANNITRFLGRGDGTFGAGANTNVGANPGQIVTTDFNFDGNPDLAVVNRSANTISVLLGNGSGGFPTARTVPVGVRPMGLALGDFNLDGYYDLAVTNFNLDSLSLVFGAAGGQFNLARTFQVGGNPYSLASMDINSDGFPDLLSGNGTTLSRLFGYGDGNFAANPPGYSPPPNYTRDFNVTLNNGALTLGVGDFDGDGITDLVSANVQNNTVSRIRRAATQTPTGGFIAPQQNAAVGATPVGIAVTDFNLDGRLDVATANLNGNSITYLIGDTGTPTGFRAPQPRHTISSSGVNPAAIGAADMNLDGWPDIVVANWFTGLTGPRLAIFQVENYDPATGDLTFTQPIRTFDLQANSFPFALALADFNFDGYQDIAVLNNGLDNVSIFMNNGDGTLRPSTEYPTAGSGPEALIARDINGDGILDLVVGNSLSHSVSVLIGYGDGTFGDPFNSTFGVGLYPIALEAIDVNLDGRVDIITIDRNQNPNQISVLLGN